jgi:hypothetical protein
VNGRDDVDKEVKVSARSRRERDQGENEMMVRSYKRQSLCRYVNAMSVGIYISTFEMFFPYTTS